MGTFRCGLILAAGLVWGTSSFAQGANPAEPIPGFPQPQPDTNIPVLIPPVQPVDPAAIPAQFPTDAGLSAPVVTNTPAAAPAPAPRKKPVAPALPTVRGKVTKLDTVGMTLTVDVKGKEQDFKITSKTRTFADSKPAILADGKVGENVTVEYRNNKDKTKDALTLRFGGPAAASAKAPVVKKAKKPAAKKPVEPVDAAPVNPAATTPLETTPAPVTPQGVTPLPSGNPTTPP